MKNKHIRTMGAVGESQSVIEKETADKFADVQEIAKPAEHKPVSALTGGRICPQISCTVTPEDKTLLEELALYAINREKKVLNTSTIIRALIRLGDKYKDELIFK